MSTARAQQPAAPPTRTTPLQIVLKLDDLAGMHPNEQYLKWLKETQAGGRIEFWCHGYDHKQWTEDGV